MSDVVEPTGITEKCVQTILKKAVALNSLTMPQPLLTELDLSTSEENDKESLLTDDRLKMLPANYPSLKKLQLCTADT
jgi:hypothetical protein